MRKKKYGFTLIEVLISITILGLVSAYTTQFIIDMQRTYSLIEGQNLLKLRNGSAFNNMGKNINSAIYFATRIPNTADAQQYTKNYFTKKIKLPSSFFYKKNKYEPLALDSRQLPEINPGMSFSSSNINTSDPSDPLNFKADAVGNSLFLVSLEDTVNYTHSTNQIRSIDLYRFHYYYLAKVTDLPKDSDGKYKIELMHWSSNFYADYEQIKSIKAEAGVNATDLFTKLKTNKPINSKQIPISGAWDYSKRNMCSATLDNDYIYTFGSDNFDPSACTGAASDTTQVIEQYRNEPFSLIDPDMGGKYYSITRNNSENNKNIRVPNYANKNSTLNTSSTDGYPHGFEVMISGQSGARRLFIRLLKQVSNASGRSMYDEVSGTFQGKDI